MRSALVALLLASCQPVPAEVGLHTGSVHLHPKPGQNNQNFGAYYRHGDWLVGGFNNTGRHASFYAAHEFRRGNAGFMLGAVSGYEAAPLLPLAAFTYRIQVGDVTLRPMLGLGTHARPAVLHLTVEF